LDRCQHDSIGRLVPQTLLSLLTLPFFVSVPDRLTLADSGPLNAGVLCFRNTDWTTWFLDSVWDMKGTPRTSEQDAMRTVLESLDEFNKPKHLVRVPQWKMNSYPDEISCHEDRTKKWAPGYWIIHFAVPPPESVCFSLTFSLSLRYIYLFFSFVLFLFLMRWNMRLTV